MALTASGVLVVPALQDNVVWFANAAAWNNYWRDVAFTANFAAAETTLYVPSVYDESLTYVIFNIGGTDYNLVTKEMFQSLKLRLNTLELAFQDMRTQLKDAGLISEAQ